MTRRLWPLFAALAIAPAAQAQNVERTSWLVRGELDHEFIDSPLAQWSDWRARTLHVGRRFDRGALSVVLTSAERFGLQDEQMTVDAYRDLWNGAYGNVRVRATRAPDVLPSWDARVEVFQALDGGWELSGSYWHLDVPVVDVGVTGVGAARYVGAWYLRGQALLTRSAGESALSFAGLARRFLRTSDELLEVAAGVGREVVVLGSGPSIDLRSTRTVQLRVQRLVSARVGVSGRLGYTTFEGVPDRLGAGVGILLYR